MREWGRVQAWIKDNVASPVSAIRSEDLEGLSPIHQRALLAEAVIAQRNWPPRVGTRAWFEAIDSTGKGDTSGHAVFLHTVLAKHRPEFSLSDAVRLADTMLNADIVPLVMAALGMDDPSPPKSEAAGKS